MVVDVITCRGAGEPHNGPHNMLRNTTLRLNYQRFRHVGDLVYPAAIGPVNEQRNPLGGVTLPEARRRGKTALAARIRETPNTATLLGYSLGAMVVSDFLEDLHAGAEYTHDCYVNYVGLVANPRRPPSDALPGYGIAGARRAYPPGITVFEIAHKNDGIPCCPDRSPLRRVADFLIAGQHPPQLTAGGLDWIKNPAGTAAAYDQAGRLIGGYLGTEHTGRYISDGHMLRLANLLNQAVTG